MIGRFTLLLAALVSLSACGKLIVCNMNSDQRSSLMPALGTSEAATVKLDDRFSDSDRLAISRAAAVWNDFGMTHFGRKFFEIELARIGTDPVPEDDDDCTFEGSSDDSFAIIREESSRRWSALGLGPQNPGVTVRCQEGSSLKKQVLLINPKLGAPNQMMSVALHEFGHTLGLGHSCSPEANKEGYVGCAVLPQNHAYREAVMYPVLRISTDPFASSASSGMTLNKTVPGNIFEKSVQAVEVKEMLRKNDTERTECLYAKP